MKNLTKNDINKKRIKDLILAPIGIYIIGLILWMLIFPTGLRDDRLGGSIIMAICALPFFLASITHKQEHFLINIYYFIMSLIGFSFLFSILFF